MHCYLAIHCVSVKSQNLMQLRAFARLMHSVWTGKEQFHSGDVMNRLIRDANEITSVITDTLPSALCVSVRLVFAFLYLFHFQSFIGAVTKVAEQVFGELKPVECRVSHPIIGRIPSAQHKKANELREDEKTIFYQRMAFVAHVKNLTRTINGQTVHLVVGGVRGYNEDKLYNRASSMKFRIFVGWQVRGSFKKPIWSIFALRL